MHCVRWISRIQQDKCWAWNLFAWVYYAGAGTYLIDACFGPTQLDFPTPCWRLNHTFNFIEMSKHLYPCVVEAGLGGYKWGEVSTVLWQRRTPQWSDTLFGCHFLCISCSWFLLLSPTGFWAVGWDWMIQFLHFGLGRKASSLMIHGDCLWRHPHHL